MYDRYKSKRKSTGIYKFFVTIGIIAAVAVFGFKYRHYIEFWKYSRNKLEKRIESICLIKSPEKRRDALGDLADIYEKYKGEHPIDSGTFFTSGEIHYLIAESYLPGNFSELCINDHTRDIGKDAKLEFFKSIRDIKKGCALDNGAMEDSFRFMLAKACFYSDYCGIQELFNMIDRSGADIRTHDVENARFYSLINILDKREDYGLKYLQQNGSVHDNIQGMLFFATAERVARKYTGAIVSYKHVLSLTSDDGVRKLVYVNLGKIYFSQSLFKESLEQFNMALKIDEKDSLPKIWIGKNYSAMGEKDKAKAVWTEVLTHEGSNAEVKELIKTM